MAKLCKYGPICPQTRIVFERKYKKPNDYLKRKIGTGLALGEAPECTGQNTVGIHNVKFVIIEDRYLWVLSKTSQ